MDIDEGGRVGDQSGDQAVGRAGQRTASSIWGDVAWSTSEWEAPAATSTADLSATAGDVGIDVGMPAAWAIPEVRPARARARRTMLWLRLGVAAAVVAIVATAAYVRLSSDLVFSDDFQGGNSGWYVGDYHGATYKYSTAGYQISGASLYSDMGTVRGDYAPYNQPLAGLSMTTTASVAPAGDPLSGIGVTCDRGKDPLRVRYEFWLMTDGYWSVERRAGDLDAPEANILPVKLRIGQVEDEAGPTPVTLTASCQTGSDQQSTRLVFTVAGAQVVDFTDTFSEFPGSGWYASVGAAFGQQYSTVTATHFELRHL
jgi:hypothetical protein